MGYYIQTSGVIGKAREIAEKYGGEILPGLPNAFSEIQDGKALVIIMVNPMFEAAAFCHNQQEFDYFTGPEETRPRQYVLIDRNVAEEQSGYLAAKLREETRRAAVK